ncbi:hypothetical protein HD553DRAFT_312960 [Filobasidium floriforme]|uniref:uncharacterized protein n=1 Tax=Filobasidium floriforme TaxID=5210 RepID=UPI001E8D9790|nr:uncharacterized protein HD553DRAFT_312960 [Filobasidium floriforme]KAH8083694.1 hypothetical protein HD553DRAFT_312960 [Filobasidium floriforme]
MAVLTAFSLPLLRLPVISSAGGASKSKFGYGWCARAGGSSPDTEVTRGSKCQSQSAHGSRGRRWRGQHAQDLLLGVSSDEFFGRVGRDESSDLVLNGERMVLECVVEVETSGRERGLCSIAVRLCSTIDVSDLIATPVQSLFDLGRPGLYRESRA